MAELCRSDAVLICADHYRRHSYGNNHPLAIPRVSLMLEFIHAYAAIEKHEIVTSRLASDAELLAFHTPDYVRALQEAEAIGKVAVAARERHKLGTTENPYFPGFFSTPATATGGSIQAAEQVVAGRMAFSPAGGMHHAMPDQAQGFCFFNDVTLAVMRLRAEGFRVLYLDIDAHHGDGVEFAFKDDPNVLTFSLHMDTGYAYPFKGGEWSTWGQLANALNVPLPRGTHDEEYWYAFETLWPRVLATFKPDAIVMQAGTDMLAPDPLGKLNISTQLFLKVVARVLADCPVHASGVPRLAVLGGGGYHPIMLARCWAGVWALLSGRDLPIDIPAEAAKVLRAAGWDNDEDEPYFESLFQQRIDQATEGPVRAELIQTVEALCARHPLLQTEKLESMQ